MCDGAKGLSWESQRKDDSIAKQAVISAGMIMSAMSGSLSNDP